MSRKFREMVEVARDYCALIERVGNGETRWLERVATLLPRLHLAIAALEEPSKPAGNPLVADLDARFELFSRLRGLLGERDAYWMEYDASHDSHCMSGSLADDLTDIYCELKHGLRMLDQDPDAQIAALDDWRSGYKVHWGRHLVDAERHIYDLQARNQLTS